MPFFLLLATAGNSLAHMLLAGVILIIAILLILTMTVMGAPRDTRQSSRRKKHDGIQDVCVWAVFIVQFGVTLSSAA